jgi:hypothetical protein
MDGQRDRRGHMKKKLLGGVLAVAMAAVMVGFGSASVSAEPVSKLWSVAVHLRYANGFEFDYVMATGVPTSRMSETLADCGSAHQQGTVVWYHCYPIPE